MSVKKAIIPVAGLGTRMLPATKAIPKEMLPVFDKPIIQHVVEEAVASGIKDIILVNRQDKAAITEHFEKNNELEGLLAEKGKVDLLLELKKCLPEGVSIQCAYQETAKGLGDAILCAQPLIGEESFAVLLPDVLIDQYACDARQDNLSAMIDRFVYTGRSQILVEHVPIEKVEQYGVVDCMGTQLNSGRSHLMAGVVEKPTQHAAPSNYCVVGRYVFDAKIWPLLLNVQPDAGGEIQLTNAIEALSKDCFVEAHVMVGGSYDCGNRLGYVIANLTYALQDQTIGNSLRAHIQEKMLISQQDNYCLAANG